METKKPRVLMVDDDSLILEMYSVKFMNAGFDFSGLPEAGSDFVEKVVQFNPDVVSMDIIMPEVDGMKAMEMLKSDPRTKNIPVMFLTNKADGVEVEKAKALGAIGYIILAHFDPTEVVEVYKKYLENPDQGFIDMSREKGK